MAVMTMDDLANLVLENYGSLITSSVVHSGPANELAPADSMFGRLRERGQVFIGGADDNDTKAREWAGHYSTPEAVSYDVSDAWPSDSADGYADASIGWKRIGIPVEADNLAILASRKGGLRGGLSGLDERVKNRFKSMFTKIEKDAFTDGTGNSSKDFTGLKAALSTSNTYAGIAQTGNAWWQANILAAGGKMITADMVDTLYANAYDNGADDGSLELWMSLTQFQLWKRQFEPFIRRMPGDESTNLARYVYDSGNGRPIMIYILRDMPTDEVWMPRTSGIELRFLDHTPEGMLADQVKDTEVFQEGIPFGIETVPSGRDVKMLMLKVYGNYVVINPSHQSAITGLPTS